VIKLFTDFAATRSQIREVFVLSLIWVKLECALLIPISHLMTGDLLEEMKHFRWYMKSSCLKKIILLAMADAAFPKRRSVKILMKRPDIMITRIFKILME